MQKLIAQMQTETPSGKLLLIPPGSVQGSPLAWQKVYVIRHIDYVMFNEMHPHLPKYSQLWTINFWTANKASYLRTQHRIDIELLFFLVPT